MRAKIDRWYSRMRRARSDRLRTAGDPAAIDRFIRWHDHGIFREIWTNMAQIAPGIWRSNHPPAGRFPRLVALGIRTVVSLRGPGTDVTYLREKALCEAHGLAFHAVALDARRAPRAEALRAVMAILRGAETPLLLHCKSGADRAGLISALYLAEVAGAAPARVRAMLAPRFLHFRAGKTGVLDLFLDRYLASGQPLDAFLDGYDPEALQAEFDRRRR